MPTATLSSYLTYTPSGSISPASVIMSVISPTYTVQSEGIINIPIGTGAGLPIPIPIPVAFPPPFVNDINVLVIKNTNVYDMYLSLNGSGPLFRLAPGGEFIAAHPANVALFGIPIISAMVITTTAQLVAGSVSYFVFGS